MKKEIIIDKELIGQTVSFRDDVEVRQGVVEKIVLVKTPCVSNEGKWTFIEDDMMFHIRGKSGKVYESSRSQIIWDSDEPWYRLEFKLPRVVEMLAELGLGDAYIWSADMDFIHRDGEWRIVKADGIELGLVRYEVKMNRIQNRVVCEILGFNITEDGYSVNVAYIEENEGNLLCYDGPSDKWLTATLSKGGELPFTWWRCSYPSVRETWKAHKENAFGEPLVHYHYDVTEDGLV